MYKKYLKKIPILRRVYPSTIKKILNIFSKKKINYSFFNLNLEGNIDEPMDKEIYVFNDYENSQINYLLNNIKKIKFDYFIDVGANSGVYSLIIGKNFKNLKIKSYEPVLSTIKKFKQNLKLNPTIKNIEINKFGLSNKNSKLLMKALKKNDYIQTGGFGVAKKNENLKNLHKEYAFFKKGDDILKIKSKKIVLKIDTEGHEQEVIEGLKNLIKKNKIFLQIEIFNRNYNLTNSLLKKNNFKKINSIKSDGKIDYYYKNY